MEEIVVLRAENGFGTNLIYADQRNCSINICLKSKNCFVGLWFDYHLVIYFQSLWFVLTPYTHLQIDCLAVLE